MRQLLAMTLFGWLVIGVSSSTLADPNKDAADKLLGLLRNDPNQYVKDRAAEALRKMGKPAVESLKGKLNGSGGWNEEFATEVATILGDIGPEAEDAVRELTAALATGTGAPPKVREAAIEALGKIFKATPGLQAKAKVAAAEAVEKAKDAAGKLKAAVAVDEKDRDKQIAAAGEARGLSDNAAKAALEAKNAASAWSASEKDEASLTKAEADDLKKALTKLKETAEAAKKAGEKLSDDKLGEEALKQAKTEASDAATKLADQTKETTLTVTAESVKGRKDAITALKCVLVPGAPFQITILAAEALGRIYGTAE